MQPQLHFTLPMAEYLKTPALSKHALDLLHRSPMEYKLWRDGQLTTEQTPAMLFGSLLHGLVLEGRRDWVTPPETYPSKDGDKPWTNAANYCKQWTADQTLPVLNRTDSYNLLATAESIRVDPFASTLFAHGKPEVSIFTDYAGRDFKGRADWLDLESGFIADVKTTTDASTESFSREISNRRYHVQAALYWKLCQTLGYYAVKEFYFIAVEKVAPYRVNVRKLKDSALEIGLQELEADLELLETCEATHRWPGLSGIGPAVQEIDIPAWKYSTGDALELTIGGKSLTL